MSKKIIFYISIVMLLIVYIFFGKSIHEDSAVIEHSNINLSFFLINEGVARSISCYYDEDSNIWNLFLPADAIFGTLKVKDIDCAYFVIDGKSYQEGDYLERAWEKESGSISFFDDKDILLERGTFKCFKSENLPEVYITTASGTMEYVHESKDNKEAGTLQSFTENGKFANAVRLDYIKGRGNTSWEADKKSYKIRLDRAEDLFGMGRAKTWLLIANYYDGTYLRNKIGTELGRAAEMKYTSGSQFVDLYINGNYEGLYQIMEGVELETNRIELKNGYLLEIDYRERVMNTSYIQMANKQPITVQGKKNITDETLEDINIFFKEFVETINTEDFVHPQTGKHIFDYIDKESWAKRYIMEEFLQDMDSGFSSHYMCLMDTGGDFVLHAGPVWDLDNTMGRGFVSDPDPFQLFADRYELHVNNLSRWHARLYNNEDFYLEVIHQYQDYFRPYLEWMLQEGIRQWEEEITASAIMDTVLWGTQRSTFMTDNTKEEHMEYLLSYIAGKTEFLNAKWNALPESRQQWLADKQPVLPEIQEQVREIYRNDQAVGTITGVDGAADGLYSFIMIYKGYFLFAALIMLLGGMFWKEWRNRSC